MIYHCVQCYEVIPFGEKDFELEIECGTCKFRTCGKCFKPSHYPALCHEYERWSTRSTRPFKGTDFLYNRFVGYSVDWDFNNMQLRMLDGIQRAHEEFSPASHERFHKRLILPVIQMGEVIEFNRWFRLHAALNPSVESVLEREHALLATRMTAFFGSIPTPEVAADEWTARILQVDLISIDLGVSVAALISGIPNAHHVAEVQEAQKGVALWTSKKMVS